MPSTVVCRCEVEPSPGSGPTPGLGLVARSVGGERGGRGRSRPADLLLGGPAGPGFPSGPGAVVGLGKRGAPAAAQFAGKGWSVMGCDILPQVVAAINAGQSH